MARPGGANATTLQPGKCDFSVDHKIIVFYHNAPPLERDMERSTFCALFVGLFVSTGLAVPTIQVMDTAILPEPNQPVQVRILDAPFLEGINLYLQIGDGGDLTAYGMGVGQDVAGVTAPGISGLDAHGYRVREQLQRLERNLHLSGRRTAKPALGCRLYDDRTRHSRCVGCALRYDLPRRLGTSVWDKFCPHSGHELSGIRSAQPL